MMVKCPGPVPYVGLWSRRMRFLNYGLGYCRTRSAYGAWLRDQMPPNEDTGAAASQAGGLEAPNLQAVAERSLGASGRAPCTWMAKVRVVDGLIVYVPFRTWNAGRRRGRHHQGHVPADRRRQAQEGRTARAAAGLG